MTHEESWNKNFELIKAYIEEHHHLPDKKGGEQRLAFVGKVSEKTNKGWCSG